MRVMQDSSIPWLGSVPCHWKRGKLKQYIFEISEKNSPVKTTDILSLTNKLGVVPYEEKGNQGNTAKEKYDEYKLAYPDTIVANSMNILIGSVGYCSYFGCVSPVYYVFKNFKNGNLRYINYIFQTTEFQKCLRQFSNGILEIRQRVSSKTILNQDFFFPELDEQNAIVEYLDTKCAQIDTIIAKEQSVIEELQEYKKAIITETIIKGLNDSVERQNQGAVWFHGVPISWTFSELRYVTRDIFDIDHWMPESQDEGIPYLMTGDLESRTSYIDFSKTKKISIEDFNRLAKNKYPCCHDIIMARYASIGNCTYVDTSNQFLVSYSCLTIRPNIDKILPMFMYYYFKSYAFSEECKVYIKSNTQGNIGKDNLRRIKLAYPSIREQALIVKYLDTKCANLDSLIVKKQSLIDKLSEYKQSLIYEVVTGKKEVPHV